MPTRSKRGARGGRLSRSSTRGIREFASILRGRVNRTESTSSSSESDVEVNVDDDAASSSSTSRRVPNPSPSNDDSNPVIFAEETDPEDENDSDVDVVMETDSDNSEERSGSATGMESRIASALLRQPIIRLSRVSSANLSEHERQVDVRDVAIEIVDDDSNGNDNDDVVPIREIVRRQEPAEDVVIEESDSDDAGLDIIEDIITISDNRDEEWIQHVSQRMSQAVNLPLSSRRSALPGGFLLSTQQPSSASTEPSTAASTEQGTEGTSASTSPQPSTSASTHQSSSVNPSIIFEIENQADNFPLGNEDDNEEEVEGPPQKIPRLDTSSRSAEEDDGCFICYEPYENSGEHRPCCLKCGHIFGKNCIDRWIKTQKRCPACNCKAMPKDVRIIYVKNLRAIDNAELERAKEDINNLKIEKNKLELSNAQLRCRLQLADQEMERLKKENRSLSSRATKGSIGPSDDESQPSTSAKVTQGAASSSITQYQSLRMPKLELKKIFQIKEANCRVAASNDWQNLLVVSHSLKSALFPSGSFAIKKFNTAIMQPFQSFPIHSKPIRDMSFSTLQTELLLTVGLDRKAVLFNTNSNCTVQQFNTESPLWSCCWNTVAQNYFYVGTSNGQILTYDIRSPQEPTNTLSLPTNDRSGVNRLRFVPRAYQNHSFNMSGLLIQKLNSVWFGELEGGKELEARYHQLPFEGPFSNADFEETSRHVLVSSRPKTNQTPRQPTVHTVCNLAKRYSEMEERDLFSCDIVQVMNGGFQETAVLCRSALFSPKPGQVYVAGNGENSKFVRVWDVANVEQKAVIRINQEVAMDFVHWKMNDTNSLGILTDAAMDVYEVK